MAETGYRYLARIIIDLMAQNIELANEYLSKLLGEDTQIIIDESWEAEMDVGVCTDYGMMDRNEKIASLTNILAFQQQGQGTVATPQNIYQTLLQVAEAIGIQNPSLYFTDPSQIPPPPRPDLRPICRWQWKSKTQSPKRRGKDRIRNHVGNEETGIRIAQITNRNRS